MNDDRTETVISYLPYKISTQQNRDLLSILQHGRKPDLQDSNYSSLLTPGAIPTIMDENASKTIENNNARIFTLPNQSLVDTEFGNFPEVKHIMNKKEKNSLYNEIENFDEEHTTQYYGVDTFFPKNLKEQVNTINITKVPALKKVVLEGILKSILKRCGSQELFWWNMTNTEHIDYRIVFIRFESIDILNWFLHNGTKILKEIFDGVNVQTESFASKYLDELDQPAKLNEGEFDVIVFEAKNLLENPEVYEKTSHKTGTEDLDLAMQYYSNYVVNANDLLEVPKDMKDNIVNDIIKFRSRVLSIEKNRRKQEIEEERKQAKQKLQRIFEGIQANEEKEAEVSGDDAVIPEDEEIEEEYQDLSDEQYEEMLRKREEIEQETRYRELLSGLHNIEKGEKDSLTERLKSLQNYENYIIENKAKFVEDFKHFIDYDLACADQLMTLNPNRIRLYYTNHPEYLAIRTQERAQEEASDLADAKAEQEEEEKLEPKIKKPAIALNPEQATPKDGFAEQKIMNVSDLDSSKLGSLRSKIEDLIEEYLGIKEEVLINFVYDFLLTNNMLAKEELIGELSETLEDDSEIVVNEIWNHLNQFI